MDDDRSLDLTGIGKLAQAIPEDAWNRVVETACTTFRELTAPITSITSGVGRLIEAKFDRLTDSEKVIAAQTMALAREKADKSSKRRGDGAPRATAKPSLIVRVIEESSGETDATLRELWSNLLANEIADGSVHPEFVNILARLAPGDAHRLAAIAQRERLFPSFYHIMQRILERLASEGPAAILTMSRGEPTAFEDAYLSQLNLVRKVDEVYKLTPIGKAFLKVVSDPSLEGDSFMEPFG